MKRVELISEILTDFKSYDESNLIDFKSLNRNIRNELIRFGANIMTFTEKVIEVTNGEAELPENFYTLYLAVRCDCESHEFIEGCKSDIQSSNFYTQRIEQTFEWDNNSNSHKGSDYKTIEEKVIYNNCSVKFRYNNPRLLKLTKGIKREYCASDCRNMKAFSCPDEMNILQNKMQFNFNKGFVYIQYYALPTDEDGDLIIPEIRSLQEYLIAYCKRKILETVMSNNDDTNVITKLNYFRQEERELFGLASTAVKFEALSKNWDKKIKQKNRTETLKYENLFPL